MKMIKFNLDKALENFCKEFGGLREIRMGGRKSYPLKKLKQIHDVHLRRRKNEKMSMLQLNSNLRRNY